MLKSFMKHERKPAYFKFFTEAVCNGVLVNVETMQIVNLTFQFRHVCAQPSGEGGDANDALCQLKSTYETCRRKAKFGFQESSVNFKLNAP